MRKFSDLFEAPQTIVFAFGRFNPPTTGHEKLINKVASVAGNVPYRIYPSFTTNPKKDPLPHALKVAYMRKMFSRHARNIIADKKALTAMHIAVKLYDDGFRDLVMVAGSDRIKEFDSLLKKYNGVTGKRHGYYKFNTISVVSAGERDPDAEGVTGMSASKMRAAAVEGDSKSFMMGLPKGFRDGNKLFQDVRKYMGIREDKDMGSMTDFESVRDAYLTGKVWNVGDLIEANGVTGIIIRKGTNYVSYNDGDGKVHKAWLHDITLDERNYAKEYANYQGRPEQIARRSSRNKARRLMGDKAVKGMDVGHKDNNPLNNDPKNLKMEDPSKNRREPRMREDAEDDKLAKTMKIATARMQTARKISAIRKQQKSRMNTLVRQKAPPERKKQLKKNQDAQVKQTRDAGKRNIQQLRKEGVYEKFTQSDVVGLEKFADRILKKYKIDVEFTRHFVDRLNDPRNDPEIKVAELQRFFKKIQRNKGIGILSSPDIEAVLKDMETNLNLPVVIKKKGNEFEVLNKTIMRKPNFKTTSKVIKYEKAPDTSDAMKRYKSGKAGFTDIAHLKAKGLIARSDGEKKKSAKYK